jgi:hypothetical protein
MYSKTGHCVKPSGRTSGQMVSTYRTNCTEPCTPRLPTACSPQEGHLTRWCQPTGPTVRSHVLQDCPLREALRRDIWPDGVNQQDQLYGDRADPEDSGIHLTSGIDCEALRKDIWPDGVNLQDQLYRDRTDMQRTAEYIR